MRKFFLYADNTKLELNGGVYLFTSPTGLGVTFNNNISDLGDGFGASTKKDQKNGQVVGKLVIQKDGSRTAYEVYHDFSNLVLNANKLVLGYQPSDVEYKANVMLSYLTKTESHDEFFIEIPVAFDLLSLWYTVQEFTFTGMSELYSPMPSRFPASIYLYCPNCLGKPHLRINQTVGGADKQELQADISELSVRAFTYSNTPDDSAFLTSELHPMDISPYITNIEEPELIYGRPTDTFRIYLTDDTDGSNLRANVKLYRYWRTV